MSLYGLSDLQLSQLTAPKAAPYYYGNTPIQVNNTGQWANGVQPGGVKSIGNTPVATGVAVDGSTAATGMPAGASTAAAGGGMGGMGGGYAGIATQAIQGIADAAQTYVKAKAQADILRNTQPVPDVPESTGAIAGFQAPPLKGLGTGALSIG